MKSFLVRAYWLVRMWWWRNRKVQEVDLKFKLMPEKRKVDGIKKPPEGGS